MRDRLDEFGPEVTVALITFTTADRLRRHRSNTPLPFPTLRDPERTSYRAYGLGRGTVRRVWGRRAIGRYRELLTDGDSGADSRRRLRVPTEDTRQLGGDFVVAPDGTLAWGFWGAGPDDRPSVDQLVAAVAATR
ncbi:MAG: AhpC/TSA family protein [Actinomycetota bacterium]